MTDHGQDNRTRYMQLFMKSPIPMWVYDYETKIFLEVNEEAIKQYGYSRKEFLSMAVKDIRPPEDVPKLRNIQFDSIYTGSWKHLDKKGRLMYVEIVAYRIEYKGREAVLALINNITERKKYEAELKQKPHEIAEAVIAAQESERQELGRELHDNINQILASARMYLDIIREDESEGIAVKAKVDELLGLAIEEIRRLSHELIAPSVGKTKLTDAIGSVLDTVSKTRGITVHKQFTNITESDIDEELKLATYRIVQEQVNNIQKYASAKNIWATLHMHDHQLLLVIKDDGVGFDLTKKRGGVGLTNIKTRASLFKGSVKIISSPGNGCELKVTFNAGTLKPA